MKTTKMIQTLTAATASLFLFANVAAAHSEHDHAKLSLQWKFSKKAEDKILARGTLQNTGYYIGLSAHEQKTMKHYGIRTGNIFTAQVDGVNAYVKRTSTGIQVMDSGMMNISTMEELPIRTLNQISRISTGNANHSGHDHAMTPYEWAFGQSTQDRIAGRLNSNDVTFRRTQQIRAGFAEQLQHQGRQSVSHCDQRSNHDGRTHQWWIEDHGAVSTVRWLK